MKLDILAIGVHPDDVELSCSGTLLRYIDEGKKVGLLDLTQGELGTRGSAKIRLKEADAAAKLMGAAMRENLGMADGFFSHTRENLMKIIPILRTYQPDIVLANAINDRHPDHGRAAKLCSDACFLSGLIKITTHSESGEVQDRWRPKALYHYIQDYDLNPDFVMDITPYMEKKMELILAYKSQFFDANSKELSSPISGKTFLEFIKARARTYGRPAGMEYAEGFTSPRAIGINDLYSLL